MTERRYHEPTPRSRSRKDRAAVFLKTDGCCWKCGQRLESRGWVEEHVVPLEDGGADDISNKMPSCTKCAIKKTSAEASQRAKERAIRDRHIGVMPESRNPIQGGRKTMFKRCMDGSVINRETGEVVRHGWR